MTFTSEGTTKRYAGNKDSGFQNSREQTYQYGCEFELYIDETKYDFKQVIQEIRESLYNITNVDILEDLNSLPRCEDKDYCMQIKSDSSLGNFGIEISIPITSKKGIEHYINEICPLISKYGYTNSDTGFHIHISTIEKSGININFYKFMLLCENEGLLSNWETRDGYSHNVMDILNKYQKNEARKIKTKKGTIWNLEKESPNHVEIKTIGGIDYHKDTQRLIDEFHQYANLFDQTLQSDTEAYKELLRKHKEQVEKADKKKQIQFMAALKEVGILEETNENKDN